MAAVKIASVKHAVFELHRQKCIKLGQNNRSRGAMTIITMERLKSVWETIMLTKGVKTT